MSVTLPSKEISVIDVPEIREFESKFVYSYHVPDEFISSEATNIPRSILAKPSEYFDSDYIDLVKTRIPRFVKIDFSPVFMQDPTKELSDDQRRDMTANRRISNGNLLRTYYDKIIGEQEFASDTFKIVNFSDQAIDKKLYDFVSSSMDMTLNAGLISTYLKADPTNEKKVSQRSSHEKVERKHSDLSLQKVSSFENRDTQSSIVDNHFVIDKPIKDDTISKKISDFNKLTPISIGYDFIARCINQPNENNIFFQGGQNNGDALRDRNITLDELKKVCIKSQINTKVFDTAIKSSLYNSSHTISSEMAKLAETSESDQKEARAQPQQISQYDYMTIIDPIEISASPTTTVVESKKRIVGYVVDKWELMPNGNLEAREPILLENQYSSNTIDYKVRYGGTYAYQMRTVAEYIVPAITQEDNQLVSVKLLICSKPTRKIFVNCIEDIPPPNPVDLDFVWNYENNYLNITWAFPPNQQRDIKKFQIFRRNSIKEPFQLLKMYDFDDTIRGSNNFLDNPENIPNEFIVKNSVPVLSHIDYDFTKNSKSIYAICSIDAHGMTSNYSMQMQITFDKFTNKIVKKLISISGSPKPYPNLNLEKDTFVDTMYTENSSRMKVYFTPEYLSLYDDKGKNIPTLSTNQKGAEYRIQIINIDNQKQQSIDIGVDDKRKFEKQKDILYKRGLKSVDPNRF